MASTYNRRINLYINGKEVNNDISSIKKEMYKLQNQTVRLNRDSDEYRQNVKKIAQLKGIVQNHNDQIRGVATMWQRVGGFVKKFIPAMGLGTVIAGFGATVQKMNQAIDAAESFEERLDNLSALTGLEGKSLEDLGETAKQTSVKITDGGVRIKQSADDIVDAYTKVGSQRPELLKNGEALASVTEDAIILSEAAKSDLEPAVKGLTTTMNQFNIGADGSRRIINAMAAGSKEGAADIPYLTQAIEKSGTTMHLMNVSLEENIGLIESVAPNYAEAAMAGNSLDKVFLKLKEKQIGYKDGVFSVNAALKELQLRYKNGESAASIFGVEHAKMGELLVQNKDEFNRYTKAVTGTNVAIEQAAKNTNNAKAIQVQMRNEFKLAAIELGQNLSPAMTKVYKAAGSMAAAFTRLISTKASEKLKEDRIEMNALFTAIKNTKEGTDERKKAIDSLNTSYGKYLPNLLTEHSTLLDIQAAQKAANDELIKNIQIKLKEEDLEELARKQKKIMDDILSDVEKRRGKSLVSTAESEIFTLLNELGSIESLDEAKNRLGAFAKIYRDASKNIGTYSENISQFFELLRIQRAQQNILGSINSISEPDNQQTINTPSEKSIANTIGNLSNFMEAELDDQRESIYKYFEEVGDGAFEAFLEAIGKTQKEKKIDFSVVPEFKEEQEEFNPDLDYATLKYQETLDYKLALNESMYEQGLIGEQQYQDRLTELTKQAEQERFNIKRESIDKAKEYTNMATNFVTAMMDLELEKAGDNEEKKKQIRKKYADVQFAVTAAQIITDTAAAIMKAFAQLGPIGGPIAAALIGATGLAQLAIANQQRAAAKGFSEGGYTGEGETLEPAGVVHRGEYVIPKSLMKNPMVSNMAHAIEALRTKRMTVNSNLAQFVNGGYVNEAVFQNAANESSPRSSSNSPFTDSTLVSEIKSLNQNISNMKIYVSIEDINNGQKRYTEIQNTRGI